jgi:hypothetical protein
MTADTNDVDWNEAELSCLDAAARAAASAWFSSSVFLPIAFGFWWPVHGQQQGGRRQRDGGAHQQCMRPEGIFPETQTGDESSQQLDSKWHHKIAQINQRVSGAIHTSCVVCASGPCALAACRRFPLASWLCAARLRVSRHLTVRPGGRGSPLTGLRPAKYVTCL